MDDKNLEQSLIDALNEQVLSDEPSEQTLVDVPGEQVAVDVPDEQIAVDVPDEQIAVDVPDEQIAVDVPDEQVAVDVPDEQIAVDVPDEQVAVDVPDEQIAVDVPSEQITVDVPDEQIAVDVPDEQVAVDVPDEQVAVDVPDEQITVDVPNEQVAVDVPNEQVAVDVPNEEVVIDRDPEEHYIRQGDPDKPTYYIIRRLPETTGLLARYRMVMGHVRYARSKNWIPVVDMQNYANVYLDPKKLGKENSWEYYFEQPMKVGLEEAYSGENIVLSDGDCVKPYPGHSLRLLERKNYELEEWRMLIKLGLIRIKPKLMQEIEEVKERLFPPEEPVLGVILRGTDYLVRKIKGRPIPPPVDFAQSIVNSKLKAWGYNKFFLATEDKKIIQAFKKTFDDRCIILDREYVDYNSVKDKFVSACRINRENDHYLQGKDYITQIVLLSMCNSLVGARCSGNTVAMLLSDSFKHTYFFNVGRYGQLTLD